MRYSGGYIQKVVGDSTLEFKRRELCISKGLCLFCSSVVSSNFLKGGASVCNVGGDLSLGNAWVHYSVPV